MTTPNTERISPGEDLKMRMMELVRSPLFAGTIAIAANNAIELIQNSGQIPEPYINSIGRDRAVENLQNISQIAAAQFSGLDGSWLRRINETTDIMLLDPGKTRRREFQFPLHLAITDTPRQVKKLEDRQYKVHISLAGSALQLNIPDDFLPPTCVIPINQFRDLTFWFDDPRFNEQLDHQTSLKLSRLIGNSVIFRSPREDMRLNQQLHGRRPD